MFEQMWFEELESACEVSIKPYRKPAVSERPVLIIGCSDSKCEGFKKAYDLYMGDMYKFLKASYPDVTERFNVFILSAKYGLVHADEGIFSYNLKMSDVEQSKFVAQAREHAQKRLKDVVKDQEVYVLMSALYRDTFKLLLNDAEGQKIKCLMSGLYMSHGHRGNGVLKSRFRRIYDSAGKKLECSYYRSGVASNQNELLGYLGGGQSICTSLYHMDGNREIIKSLVHAACKVRVLVDNGFASMMKNGESIDTDKMMQQYRDLLGTIVECYYELARDGNSSTQSTQDRLLRGDDESDSGVYVVGQGYMTTPMADVYDGIALTDVIRNFSFVIPDSTNPTEAVSLVRKYSSMVKDMGAMGVQWILPVHRKADPTDDIQQRLKVCMDSLQGLDLRIGLPTRDNFNVDLSEAEIESILSLTGDDKLPVVTKVHLLGQGDTCPKASSKARSLLVKMYGVDVTMDAMRTRPVFSSEKVKSEMSWIGWERKLRIVADEVAELKRGEADCPSLYEYWNDLFQDAPQEFVRQWNLGVERLCSKRKTGAYHLMVDESEVMEHHDLGLSIYDECSWLEVDMLYVDVYAAVNVDDLFSGLAKGVVGSRLRMAVLEYFFSLKGGKLVKSSDGGDESFAAWSEIRKAQLAYY
ncbi:DUF6884 domain-containing protein [Vibrio breoganii]